MSRRGSALALVASLAAATPVHAQPATPASRPAAPAAPGLEAGPSEPPPPTIRPDRRALAQAREANFEPVSVREGFGVAASLGPAMQLGFGISESSGTGGGFGLRVGTVASPRWIWLLDFAATFYRREDDTGKARVNQSATFTVGGQYYLRDAVWARAGVGLATFTRRTENLAADTTFRGVGVSAAVGLDLYRTAGLAWSIEAASVSARYRDGSVVGGGFQLGLSWY